MWSTLSAMGLQGSVDYFQSQESERALQGEVSEQSLKVKMGQGRSTAGESDMNKSIESGE